MSFRSCFCIKSKPLSLFFVVTVLTASACAEDTPEISVKRVPDQGLQPQTVMGPDGAVHLIYFKGEPASGNIFYRRLDRAKGDEWISPIRVNSQEGSAVAMGTIRGANIAIGRANRVHVAWNGSSQAEPKGIANPAMPEDSPYRFSAPMLYSRLDSDGKSFEEQRNLMTHTYALDGGGSIAADQAGLVHVAWHANSVRDSGSGEKDRAVWVATSLDSGDRFAPELRGNQVDTGACGCCGLSTFCDSRGQLAIIYRTATDTVNRDLHLLWRGANENEFESQLLSQWSAATCMMSKSTFCQSGDRTFAAWEWENRVQYSMLKRDWVLGNDLLDRERSWTSVGGKSPHKHPCLAVNKAGQMLLAWTEGTGWKRGGEISWQVFDRLGKPLRRVSGKAKGLPAWSFAAAYANGDGSFTILY